MGLKYFKNMPKTYGEIKNTYITRFKVLNEYSAKDRNNDLQE
ncbi:hypothetical protein [Leptotrichia massiliensis]|nr:hypothetical protein [Leptotrichia massiliensis]